MAFQGLQLITLATQTSANLNFDYVANLRKDPTTGDNVPAAITNAFYVVNTYHDIAYRYGFTETTFNFQTNNFNKGGQGFDRVLVRVQDTSGTNGADMTVLPECVHSWSVRRLGFSDTKQRPVSNTCDVLIYGFQRTLSAQSLIRRMSDTCFSPNATAPSKTIY